MRHRSKRYKFMINNFLLHKLNYMDTVNMWFEKDGTMCHTAHAIMDILRERFDDMAILHSGDMNWQP